MYTDNMLKAKRTIGRKTKYSAKLSHALCRWIAGGCSYKDTCLIESISYETLRVWKE